MTYFVWAKVIYTMAGKSSVGNLQEFCKNCMFDVPHPLLITPPAIVNNLTHPNQ